MEKKLLMGAGVALSVATAAWAGGAEEQTRDVSSFNEVSLHGSMDVDIQVGKKQSVRVVADDKVIDDLETEVRGDRLHIKLKEGRRYRNIKKMNVYITVPELEAGYIHGSGDMIIKGDIEGDFEFSVHGSGNGNIEQVKAEDLELSIHGSGNIQLNGSCGDLEASVHGSGDVFGRKLECEHVDVDIHGSGDVAIQAKKTLNASIYGSGDVDVYGEPDKVRTRVRGSGDINVK